VNDPAPDASRAALNRLVLGLGAAGFASTFTMRALDPLVPTLAAEFGQSITTTAMIATAFSFAYALGQPFLGPVADAVGKTRTVKLSLLALAILSVLVGLAFSFGALAAFRALTGIVAGGIIPVAMATIGDRAPMKERQIVLGRFLITMIVGQMSGAAFSGVVSDLFGWRAVFVLASGVSMLALALLWFAIRRDPPEASARPSVAGAMANYRAVFSNPNSLVLYLLVIVDGALVFGIPPYVAAIIEARTGAGATESGLVIAGTGIGGIVYGLSTRQLVQRLGQAKMAMIGGLIMALALSAFALPLPWWTGVIIFIVLGFGFFLMHGTFQVQATELAPDARSSGVALFACALFIGHAIGPLLFAGIFTAAGSKPLALLFFAAGIAVLGMVAPRVLGLGR
jgi:MFS transporter, YNFM family, putative membrane transport protein